MTSIIFPSKEELRDIKAQRELEDRQAAAAGVYNHLALQMDLNAFAAAHPDGYGKDYSFNEIYSSICICANFFKMSKPEVVALLTRSGDASELPSQQPENWK